MSVWFCQLCAPGSLVGRVLGWLLLGRCNADKRWRLSVRKLLKQLPQNLSLAGTIETSDLGVPVKMVGQENTVLASPMTALKLQLKYSSTWRSEDQIKRSLITKDIKKKSAQDQQEEQRHKIGWPHTHAWWLRIRRDNMAADLTPEQCGAPILH